MIFFVKIQCCNETITKEYTHEVLLSDVIRDCGFTFDLPCGGRGVCGNCKVIAKGLLSAPDEKEKTFLGCGIGNNERLACFTKVIGDAEIIIPKIDASKEVKNEETTHYTNPISGNKNCFACAVDIGTTTIVFRYFSLPDGNILLEESVANPQRNYGADVLTRIELASTEKGLLKLKALIENEIEKSVTRFGNNVEYFIFTGNTAMLHILLGNCTDGLAVAPFKTKTLFGHWDNNRYFMPCADAYIGGDVIASVIASGMLESNIPTALLDIGTNNECVLFDGENLFACSSPAGPAFEGGNISCGVSAIEGAIYKVVDKNGLPEVHIIGNTDKAKGFCGSGLIDAIAFLLKNGYIAIDGSIIREFPDFCGVSLTAEDVAELQLAKSAVCAGLLTLCEAAGVFPKRIFLSGSFGHHIDFENAEMIGLLPKGYAEICEISNSAIDGASDLLLDKKYIKSAEEIADKIKVIELADSEFFAKSFVENMYF